MFNEGKNWLKNKIKCHLMQHVAVNVSSGQCLLTITTILLTLDGSPSNFDKSCTYCGIFFGQTYCGN